MSVSQYTDDHGRAVIKAMHDGYRSGYGQAKADILDHVNEAIRSCRDAIQDAPKWGATSEAVKELSIRVQELHRIRASIKAVGPKIAGG